MISYNDLYYIKDGKPWCPVMGEYQYSRTDARYWREGLAKMKATGINTVASYVFWLHHEEVRNRFDFRGNRNLRKFLRQIKEAGMFMCLRIGPWVHAEARNGGFPDWIYNEKCELRSNDPLYMYYVERFFKELYKQCEGYMYSDGGPIFAIQVENEYSQWGVQTETRGDVHINALIEMLKKIGFDVPVYMATGWGEAAIGNAIPVWGMYAEQPWAQTCEEMPPNEGFLISSNPNDPDVGSDTGSKEMDFDIAKCKYPYSTVELGAGIQITKHRRPIISGVDNGAIALCKIASEASGIGYYVYHGGMNPIGALSSMQEYYRPGPIVAGFCSDLPEMNYDFQAAIGQYEKMHESAFELKLLNYFMQEFPTIQMHTRHFADNATDRVDYESMRYSLREDGESGFLFINNYVRRATMPDREIKEFAIDLGKECIVIPNLRIQNGEYVAFPLNMPLGEARMKWATATPLCILNGQDYVFWNESGTAEYTIEGKFDGKVIVLTKQEALRCFKFTIQGEEKLLIANGELYQTEKGLHLNCTEKPILKVYPDFKTPLHGLEKMGMEGDFAIYTAMFTEEKIQAQIIKEKDCGEYVDFTVSLDYGENPCENAFLYVDYAGDTLDLLVDGEKVNDHYYLGVDFEVGLRNYDFPKELTLRIYPLKEETKVYLERRPDFKNERALEIRRVYAQKEYRYIFR